MYLQMELVLTMEKKNAKAGIGIYISDDFTISEKLTGLPTNQRAELYAILKALELTNMDNYSIVYIYTDSLYSINCITKWVYGWINNGWLDKKKKPVKTDIYSGSVKINCNSPVWRDRYSCN